MDHFEQLGNQAEDEKSVLCFPSYSSLFKVGEFLETTRTSLGSQGIPNLAQTLHSRGIVPSKWNDWLNGEVDCEILKPTKGWRKGKLKLEISLKFYPDEPELSEIDLDGGLGRVEGESPLDGIRQTINN